MASCICLEDIESFEYIDTGIVYDLTIQDNENYYIDAGKPILVHNSSKTWSSLQLLYMRAIQHPGWVITVCGQDIPNLKKGALRDALRIWNDADWLRKVIPNYNQSERVFTCKNGSIIEFNSYDDEQDAKSGKRHLLFVNEANGVPWDIYWQLAIRTERQIIIDYNPTAQFWAHDKLIGQPDTTLFISDHRHNPFLPEAMHKEIEGITDPDLWRVYARGLTGNLKGTIYPNWKVIDGIPESIEKFIWGIDYGYTNDPTAIVKIGIGERDTLYLKEIAYTPGLNEYQIKDLMTANGYDGEPIYSEHDLEMIANLRRLGMNVYIAKKGEGSIKLGILRVKRFTVYYTIDSVNIHNERLKYRFQYVGDYPTNTPEKTPDHCMDALRYGISTHFQN